MRIAFHPLIHLSFLDSFNDEHFLLQLCVPCLLWPPFDLQACEKAHAGGKKSRLFFFFVTPPDFTMVCHWVCREKNELARSCRNKWHTTKATRTCYVRCWTCGGFSLHVGTLAAHLFYHYIYIYINIIQGVCRKSHKKVLPR